jgi:N-acylneuraminate cytidylyltransferase
VLGVLEAAGRTYDCFSILRPTSPFRSAVAIRRAWQQFIADPSVDSLRAVELCKQHPGKMWVVRGERMLPLLPLTPEDVPWHSSQYQALPQVYVQNASLEIAHTRVVFEQHTISGVTMRPFMTEGHEGFDINQARDWELAESMIEQGQQALPRIDKAPYARTSTQEEVR